MNIKSSLILFFAAWLAFYSNAQESDSTQEDIRSNPVIDTIAQSSVINYPSYLNLRGNHIQLNGDDWSGLGCRMRSADSTRVNIVHIGDSHLQADIGTAVTRNRLGQKFGSAGRALVVPFKLAGTNEPNDYTIKTTATMRNSRLLKTPWATTMGFTGISLEPEKEIFDFEFSTREPFDSVEVYYTGFALELAQDSLFTENQPGLLKVGLESPTTSTSLKFRAKKGTSIHGFNLHKGNTGIAYNVIGNNGATYGTYNAVNSFADGVSRFSPALIIISLGTNEAFGKTSDEELRRQMDMLIRNLRQTCPDAKLLLTTPAECQRKIVTRRRSGKRRRARRTTSYLVNANINRLRNVILDYGKDEGIPVYDFYDVAGGSGSSFKWLSDRYLNKDRIHLTHAGYTLQGNLFTDALEEAIGMSFSHTQD